MVYVFTETFLRRTIANMPDIIFLLRLSSKTHLNAPLLVSVDILPQ